MEGEKKLKKLNEIEKPEILVVRQKTATRSLVIITKSVKTKNFHAFVIFLYEGLFKIVVEIVGYFLHEVNAAFTHYIMLGAWIDEVVNWNVVGYAYIEEIE